MIKVLKRGGIVICIIGFIALGTYNIVFNKDFFKTPLTTLVSVLVAIILSYYLTQRKVDDRRRKEKIDQLLYKIQGIVLEDNFIIVQDTDLILHRSVANKIQYLEKNIPNEIRDDVNRLANIFKDYRYFYGEHYKDDDYMKKSKKDLLNYITKIDDICDSIHMKLS